LASATLFHNVSWLNIEPLTFSLYAIAGIILIYTVLGGLKAVIYTDAIQWAVLLVGLVFFAIPFAVIKIGGLSIILSSLPKEFFSLTNISLVTLLNWMITIVPIWLVAMTLYQRMYACATEKEAKKAWFIAGVFEYPIMAFMGVFLGMMARILFPFAEPEMGLPLLIQSTLPIGITGIVVAAYFSAIMSTADSCLLASSGNFVHDIIQKYFIKNPNDKTAMRLSQLVTLIIGITAIIIASSFTSVLKIILYAYSFMVSGLFIPTLAAYIQKKCDSWAGISSMLSGGTFSLFLILSEIKTPLGLDSSFYGILLSAVVYISVYSYRRKTRHI